MSGRRIILSQMFMLTLQILFSIEHFQLIYIGLCRLMTLSSCLYTCFAGFSRCVGACCHHVCLAVSALLRSQLEPASRLFASRISDDVRHRSRPLSTHFAEVQRGDDRPMHAGAVLWRDDVDVCHRLLPSQRLSRLSRLPVLSRRRQRFVS